MRSRDRKCHYELVGADFRQVQARGKICLTRRVLDLIGIRLPEFLLAEIERWSKRNDAASRSEAIRRLIEIGLQFDGQKRSFDVSRGGRAEELAGLRSTR